MAGVATKRKRLQRQRSHRQASGNCQSLRQGLAEPRVLPKSAAQVDLTPAPGAKWWAGGVIAGAAVLYVIFW